ncbi:hypothetical protein QIU19_00435 [Capnocytophaga canimorsus]|nr:hypothetical protein [Capnocytophaga canimorsus]WGU68535.1 hypothetical protein QIU19_00435 [Capnocytophaga canimorsus]
MQLHDIVSGTVAKERLEDKIKECQKLTDENLDLKSEVRDLKEQTYFFTDKIGHR